MKVDEKELGQLFLVGFDGLEVDRDHQIVRSIIDDGLGGVILFDRNIDGSRQNIVSPGQLQELTSSLQHFAGNVLLIAVDQEGGRICRLKESDDFPATLSAGKLGQSNSPELDRHNAERLAATLRNCGINFNLAPVVDLDLNPENPIIARFERSFGADPDIVASHASLFINVHHQNGVACCLKHFPGHGSASADSHLGFVDISDCWKQEELEPYNRLITKGLADAVMTAHVVHRGMDKEGLPATMSYSMITELLKEKMGFSGVVVSDDLQMKAITNRWSFEESVQGAVLAGIDLLIVGNNLVREKQIVQRGVRAIVELLDKGLVNENSIRSSLDRIRDLKQKITGVVPWKTNHPIT